MKSNKAFHISLWYLIICVLASVFAYAFIPDNTRNANEQHTEIALKSPGFTTNFLLRNNPKCVLISPGINTTWFTGIKTEREKAITLSAFPNPFTSYFILSTNEVDVDLISITNATGQLVKTIIPTSNETMISMETFPVGMYVIQLVTPTEIKTEKVIKN